MNLQRNCSIWLIIFFLFFGLISIFGQDWKERKDWPDDFTRPPQTNKSLFFIQRNKNHNTIVYDINLEKDGQINTGDPIDVYWRRYGSNGARKDLSWLEEMLAYGYRSKRDKKTNTFRIKLRAYDERSIILQKKNERWQALMQINNRQCFLKNIYVYADESGIFPKVIHVDIYGLDIETGDLLKERLYN